MNCPYVFPISYKDEIYYYCELNETKCIKEYQGKFCSEDHSCPVCGEPLDSFSGLEHMPSYLYCPRQCTQQGYDDEMNVIVELI